MDEIYDIQLSNKYRPRKLGEILGAETMKKTLAGYAAWDRVPPTILLLGPPGVGKTTTARVIAAMLNCPERTPEGDCCGGCKTCNSILEPRLFHPAFLEIDATRTGSVEDARGIVDHFSYAHGGKVWVAFFDEAHALSREAIDVFLAVWEEPPMHVLSIIATTEEKKIPPMVKSRSRVFRLGALGADELVTHLRHVCDQEGIEAEDGLLTAIWARTSGIPREALGLLEACWMAGITRASDLPADSEDRAGDIASDLLTAVASGDEVATKAAVKLADRRGLARDVAEDLSQILDEALEGADRVGRDNDHRHPALAGMPREALEPLRDVTVASGKVRSSEELARLAGNLLDTIKEPVYELGEV